MRLSILEVMDGGDGDEEIGRLQDLRGLDDADHRILPFGAGFSPHNIANLNLSVRILRPRLWPCSIRLTESYKSDIVVLAKAVGGAFDEQWWFATEVGEPPLEWLCWS